jgi:hypothetical protein
LQIDSRIALAALLHFLQSRPEAIYFPLQKKAMMVRAWSTLNAGTNA